MNFTKSLFALALSGMLFASCKDAGNAPQTEIEGMASTEAVAPEKLQTASFNIEGMSCAVGCAKTIEKKLTKMDGVQNASVDFETKTATVEFDSSKLTPETLVETVEAAADGKTYTVSNVKSSGDHAMLFPQDQEKEKKSNKKKKGNTEAATTDVKDAKQACCSGKKHCSADEKKA